MPCKLSVECRPARVQNIGHVLPGLALFEQFAGVSDLFGGSFATKQFPARI